MHADPQFYTFRGTVKELERRLASVVTQGFDDCGTVIGRFKLLDSFDALTTRPAIADELETKHADLVSSYAEDLRAAVRQFHEQKDEPPIPRNLPPIAGKLTWCRGILERIQQPMNKMRAESC